MQSIIKTLRPRNWYFVKNSDLCLEIPVLSGAEADHKLILKWARLSTKISSKTAFVKEIKNGVSIITLVILILKFFESEEFLVETLIRVMSLKIVRRLCLHKIQKLENIAYFKDKELKLFYFNPCAWFYFRVSFNIFRCPWREIGISSLNGIICFFDIEDNRRAV